MPVRGAGAPLMVAPPMELKAVVVKVSVEVPPVPPSSAPTRWRMALLGALKCTSTSPTQVWLIFIFTLISVMVALAGIPAMVRFEVAATPVPSGIGTLIVPELALACPGTGGAAVAALNKVPLIPATPPHETGGVMKQPG
ncbi:MAG: hypothetical protein IPH68_06750 [Chitinophagaceae bacterium]|nr:hypothetical protein [Chitinophagaceae bacterium]